MVGRALLWPGAHFYRRGTHLYCPGMHFSVKICFLMVGCACMAGAHFYGPGAHFCSRDRQRSGRGYWIRRWRPNHSAWKDENSTTGRSALASPQALQPRDEATYSLGFSVVIKIKTTIKTDRGTRRGVFVRLPDRNRDPIVGCMWRYNTPLEFRFMKIGRAHV